MSETTHTDHENMTRDHRTHAPVGHNHMGQGHTGHDHSTMIADFRRRFWVSLILTVPVLALSPLIQSLLGIQLRFPGDSYVLFGLSAIVFFYGGWPFLTGLIAEVSSRRPGMMTLIGVAITVAFVYSTAVVFGLPGKVFFWELVTLIDVMLLGHWIEMKSVLGASRALEALVQLLPATAHRLKADDEAEDVPVAELKPDDRVLVKPGERVPIDGIIVKGRSSFNGESRPVEKAEGQEAVGGAVNGEGAVTLEVHKTSDQTYLSQVVSLVRQAQETRSRTQDLANRAALWLTYIGLSAGGLTLLVWLGIGQSFVFALERMVTVMVITCPHALGLAVPLVVAVSTRLTAQNGLLIRDRAAFERARNLGVVLFDKTGTLTEGRFDVSAVVPLAELGEEEILAWAAGLESQSEHPIAEGVVRGAGERGVKPKSVQEFKNFAGRGAEAVIEGRRVEVVSPGYIREQGLAVQNERVRKLGDEGNTVVYVLLDEKLVGAVALADVVRKESYDAVARLKAMGIRCMMVTGDATAS
jgi:P-type Cu2+ transporter